MFVSLEKRAHKKEHRKEGSFGVFLIIIKNIILEEREREIEMKLSNLSDHNNNNINNINNKNVEAE